MPAKSSRLSLRSAAAAVTGDSAQKPVAKEDDVDGISGATDLIASPVARPAEMSGMWWRTFPGEEREIAALRRWVARLLPDCPARDDVACVASELGANAVRHTASGRGGQFGVQIICCGPVIRVAVADSGAPAGPQAVSDPTGESGRGLVVVRGLSSCTGVCGDRRGRLVWADVPVGEATAGVRRSGSPQIAAVGDWPTEIAGLT